MTRGVPIGCGGLLVIVLFSILLGRDPQQLIEVLEESQMGGTPGVEAPSAPPAGDRLGEFASVVLADTETTWHQIFRQELGTPYREPTLVLFSNAVRSACGFASAAVGPFYCPADQKVYLDLAFFAELDRRFGAPGDFAQAYVIAHEVGHHVQNLLGISSQVESARRRGPVAAANRLSVRLELQADCLAGVWGNHAYRQGLLEPGDIEEGLRAAEAIGDDAIQTRTAGYTRPETWTHGSSEQRAEWLRLGLERGDPNACDTFG